MKIADLPEAVKSLLNSGGLASVASREAYNIRTACTALASIAELTAQEAWEDGEDPRDVKQLASTMQQLARYVSDEAGEILSAIDAKASEITAAAVDQVDQVDTEKVLSLGYVKALHLSIDDERMKDLVAAKATGRDRVRAYSHLWGDPDLVDVEREYFTKSTDFWDDELATWRRPLTYDHGQEESTKASPIIGHIDAFGDDDVGRWYEAELDKNHKYRKAIDRLISARVLGSSSDSAPQYVVRKSQKSGSVWLAVWPWFACALTPTPAEPRMLTEGSPVIKSAIERCSREIDLRTKRSAELNSRPDSLIATLDLLSL
jgi:hypothetical protein